MKQVIPRSLVIDKKPDTTLRAAIQEGIHSGPAIKAEDVFAELQMRYAEPKCKAETPKKTG